MAIPTEGKGASGRSDGRGRGRGRQGRREEHRQVFRRASDERNAAVGALGEWLIQRQWRPVLLVKQDLTLISSNHAARKVLGEGGWLRHRGPRVEVLDSDLGQQLKSAVEQWPKPRSASIVLSSSERRFDLTALELDHRLPKVYVLTILQPPGTPVDAEQLTRAAGLTQRQAKVAVMIYEGGEQGPIAQTLGVSVNAVKSRLKGIYARVGVRSQRELTRWVAELVARERG